MSRAISYIRFSSGTQAKGSSTQRQQEMIDHWLKENPEYPLASNLSKLDHGKSGYKGEHLKEGAGLRAILDGIEAGLIKAGDVLLIEALDRLGRLPSTDMIDLFLRILRKGITIVTLEDGQTYTEQKANRDSSLLFILVGKVQSSNDYSERLSRRIKAAWDRKREQARNGIAIKKQNPFWLDSFGKLKEPESTHALNAIDMYLSGFGYRKIDQELGYKTNFKTLKKLFHNRALIGDWVTPDGEIIAGVYEPLIEEKKFRELQFTLKQREMTQAPPSDYLLSGLLVCGECGSKLTIRKQEHKDGKILYCNCSSYLKDGSCKHNTTYDYSVLEHLFMDSYQEVLVREHEEWNEALSDQADEAALKDQIEIKQKEVDNVTEAIAIASSVIPSLVAKLELLNGQLTVMKKQLSDIYTSRMNFDEWLDSVYSNASNLINEPVKLNAILRNLGFEIICLYGRCSHVYGGDHTIYEILRRVGIPAQYLVKKYYLSDLFGMETTYEVNYLAINRFSVHQSSSFLNLINEIKGEQAVRWLKSVARKEFYEILKSEGYQF